MKEIEECESRKQKEKDEIVQDADFCCTSDRLKVNIRWNDLHFWWSHICVKFFGMRETDGGITHQHRMKGVLSLALWDMVIDVLEPPAGRARRDPFASTQIQNTDSQNPGTRQPPT